MRNNEVTSVLTVSEASLQMDEKRYVVRLLKLDNALLVFLNEGKAFSLGTLAFGMPDLGGTHHLSSVMLGERNVNIARLFAERLSASSGMMVLVSGHFSSELSSNIYARIMELAEILINGTKRT